MPRKVFTPALVVGTTLMAILACSGGGSNAPAPAIANFAASPVSITTGGSAQLTATYSNGTGLVTPGNLALASGVPLSVSPTTLGANTYTLTVSGPGGATTATAAVTVVAAPQITSFLTDKSLLSSGQSAQLTAVFSGGTGVVTPGNFSITSGTPLAVSPSASTTYTLTVNNSLGAQATSTLNVGVVAPAQLTSFTADQNQLWLGQNTQLRAVFAGGTGVVAPGNLAITSGAALPISPTANTTYTLTVTNSARAIITANTSVNVETQPSLITSFTANPAMFNLGSSTQFSWVLGGGQPQTLALNGTNVFGSTQASLTPSGPAQTFTLQAASPLGAAARSVTVQPWGIYPFLGTFGGDGNLDGQGSAARFEGPWSVVRDAAGNRYVSDTYNHAIRKITPGGLVTTFAGQSQGSQRGMGYLDGKGTAAQFNAPTGLAIDGFGNLYVSDEGNYVIRKITPSGDVSTLAGQPGVQGHADGTGSGATFAGPSGLAVDGAGNLYVADENSGTIRKVTPTGKVTTIAGTAGTNGSLDATGPTAKFSTSLQGLALDPVRQVPIPSVMRTAKAAMPLSDPCTGQIWRWMIRATSTSRRAIGTPSGR